MQKTSLKLLLVFVEYTESNARLVWEAVQGVDASRGELIFRHLFLLKYSSSCNVTGNCGLGLNVFAKRELLVFSKQHS